MNRDFAGSADTLVRRLRTGGALFRTGVSALLLFFAASVAQAHNPDTSYLHCAVTKQALALRFTFDIATLFRITRPDADGDGRVTRAELGQVAPEVFAYLEKCVPLEINGGPASPLQRGAVVWPPEAGDAILEKDYHQVLVHFPLHLESPAVIEDFYVNYEVFDELGDRHRIIADIEQEGAHHEVIFSQFEPDYLFDTFWRPDPPTARESFRTSVAGTWKNPVFIMLLVPPLLLRRPWLSVSIIAQFVWLVCLAGRACATSAASSVWPVIAGAGTALGLAWLTLLPLMIRPRRGVQKKLFSRGNSDKIRA